MAYFCVNIRSKKLLSFFMILIVTLLIGAEMLSVFSVKRPSGATMSDRIEYLRQIDLSADYKTESVKETVIPKEFSAVYEIYNDIQLSAGFDLKKHKGCKVVVYEYKLDSPTDAEHITAHIIVCDGEIIGGDICNNSIGGEMLPLK